MIDYFIVCHDQKTILKDIEDKKYKNLPNFKFLFVGNSDYSLIENIENVLILILQKENIEKYKRLCSYTAWNASHKNNLSKNKYSCLLEYDSKISEDFHHININNIKEHDPDFCYYLRTNTKFPVFYKSTPYLEFSLKKIYNIEIKKFLRNCSKTWPTSTNILLKNSVLGQFVDWFDPATEIFRERSLGSYVHERAFFVFSEVHKLKSCFIPNVLRHDQNCSHGSDDVYGMFLKKHNRKDLPKDLYKEYMIYYNNILKAEKEFLI